MPGDSPAYGGSSSGPWPAFHGRFSTEAVAGFLAVFIKCDCQVSGSACQPAGVMIGTPAGDALHSSDCGLKLPQILSRLSQVCSNTEGDMGVVCPSCGNSYHWLLCGSGCLYCLQNYCNNCARHHEQCRHGHQEARSQQQLPLHQQPDPGRPLVVKVRRMWSDVAQASLVALMCITNVAGYSVGDTETAEVRFEDKSSHERLVPWWLLFLMVIMVYELARLSVMRLIGGMFGLAQSMGMNSEAAKNCKIESSKVTVTKEGGKYHLSTTCHGLLKAKQENIKHYDLCSHCAKFGKSGSRKSSAA
jgi:hypothetical protein